MISGTMHPGRPRLRVRLGKLFRLTQFTPWKIDREIPETGSQNNASEARYKIAKPRVSPRHPHLEQFDDCREERQSNALGQTTPWITKHERQAS
jgi:hypothetical protein